MRDYLASIAGVDENVGKLLDYLNESGLADNTIVIYCADQGFYLAEHGWFDKRFVSAPLGGERKPDRALDPVELAAYAAVTPLILNLDEAIPKS
jgi:arylsulfatase A-like enzyme